jgi:hypothetical protein
VVCGFVDQVKEDICLEDLRPDDTAKVSQRMRSLDDPSELEEVDGYLDLPGSVRPAASGALRFSLHD